MNDIMGAIKKDFKEKDEDNIKCYQNQATEEFKMLVAFTNK